MIRLIRPALLSLVLLVVPVTLAGQQAPAPHDTLRGAIRTVDVRTRALDVTTGVGLALRIVRLQVPADLPVALAELRPGDIVRVTYGVRPSGFIAYSLERIGRMDSGLDVTP